MADGRTRRRNRGIGTQPRKHRARDDALHHRILYAAFAETPRDTIFTTEYSMRTGMEAVYTLCDVDRGVPEVWGSTFDVRDLLMSSVKLRDGKPITDMAMPFMEKAALDLMLKKIGNTDLGKILREYDAIQ